MTKYYARMSEEYITATLEAVMQKHDPTAAAITNEQERMIQEWGSDVIVLLSNQLSEAIAEAERLRAMESMLKNAIGATLAWGKPKRRMYWHQNRDVWIVVREKPPMEIFRDPHQPSKETLYDGTDLGEALKMLVG